jgi:hypothetical protein
LRVLLGLRAVLGEVVVVLVVVSAMFVAPLP